jgi:hypothetical protein
MGRWGSEAFLSPLRLPFPPYRRYLCYLGVKQRGVKTFIVGSGVDGDGTDGLVLGIVPFVPALFRKTIETACALNSLV